MRYVIPLKPMKRDEGAFSRSSSQLEAQADPAPSAAEVPSWGRFVITPAPKRPRMEVPQGPSSVERSSRASCRLDKRKGIEVAVNLKVLHVPERPLVMPGLKINDL